MHHESTDKEWKFYLHSSCHQFLLPRRIAKLSGLHDLSFDCSLLAIERSTQFFASEMQDVRIPEGRSKDAASAHKLSCILTEIFLLSAANIMKH